MFKFDNFNEIIILKNNQFNSLEKQYNNLSYIKDILLV